MEPRDAPISPAAAVAAGNLRRDAVAVEVVGALRAAKIEPIVLKGLSVAHRLGDDAERPYEDTDLLVPAERLAEAEDVLRELAFQPYLEGADVSDRWIHPAWAWSRGDEHVDLHHNLPGAGCEPTVTWRALREHVETVARGRIGLPVLDAPAGGLVFALHAAQHGAAVARPLHDLELAVRRLDRETWEEAAALAVRLDATPAFAAGLRLVPDGRALADELELSTAKPVHVALAAASAPPQALAVEQLASQPGVVAKARFAAGRIVPPAPWMRSSYPIAARGRAGLVAAHGWRWVSAPARLWSGVAAWRVARRDAAK